MELAHDGELYSIKQRMIDLGFSDEERAKLSEAKFESDDLTNLEDVAMSAVKGLFKDDEGRFTIKGEPDLLLASRILHGQEYHAAKSRIMKPIDEFFGLLAARTARELDSVRARNQAIAFGIAILAALTIGFALHAFFLLRKRITSPLEMLRIGVRAIEDGNYSHSIDLERDDEVGALALAFNSMAQSLRESQKRYQRLLDDDELARTVTESFLTDVPKQIEALKNFLAAGDAPSLRRQAHTVKGAAANIGGERLRACVLRLEESGGGGDWKRRRRAFERAGIAIRPSRRHDEDKLGVVLITQRISSCAS